MSRGSLRRLGLGWLGALCGALAWVLAFGVAGAGAAVTSFGSGELSNPIGVAVDQSSHDVYVGNLTFVGNDKFDSAGNLIVPPSPFGEGSGIYSGVAVNPANGRLYVLDAAMQAIQTYDPSSGAKLSEFSISGSGNFFGAYTVVQIASDAAGDVYVPNAPNNGVQEFDSSGKELMSFSGSGSSALSAPTGVAVDSSGNVWVADAGDGRVEEFDSSGTVTVSIASPGVQALALDASGDVFALAYNGADSCEPLSSPCYHVLEYGPAGERLADFGAGTIGASFYVGYGAGTEIAVDQASHTVYATDSAGNVVWAFNQAAPVLDREYTGHVTSNMARLDAEINPEGLETTYRVEYGTTTEYGQSTPEESVGSNFSSVPVETTVTALANSTTYHYRVVVHNSLGTVEGPDKTFMTFPPSGARSLPDNRAYEMVSPADKNNYDIVPDLDATAPNGNAFTFAAGGAFAGNEANDLVDQYLATRTPGGWVTKGVTPSHPPDSFSTLYYFFAGASSDLSQMIFETGAVTEAATPGTTNLYRREADGSLRLLTPNMPPGGGEWTQFAGASTDFSHILFESTQALLSGASNQNNLYEWDNGTLNLVAASAMAGSGVNFDSATHAISENGSRVYYTTGRGIYLREGGVSTAITTSQCTGEPSCATGTSEAHYWTASADGSKAFFTSGLRLTNDAVAGMNLYEYEVSTDGNIADGKLTDLTISDPSGAGVLGVVNASEDGSYVYFVASGMLASGASPGKSNLYVWHDSVVKSIATLSENDESDWTWLFDDPLGRSLHAQVSADGQHLLFLSAAHLSDYENQGHTEVYLYNASSGVLTCMSCNPSGAVANGDAFLGLEPYTVGVAPFEAVHSITGDGERVFFQTTDGLVPQDMNGIQDVYEWETDGKGDCHSSADGGGCLYLISSGQSSSSSTFLNTTPSGEDAFFLTRERLLGQDIDENVDVYDARVNGGFAGPAQPLCTGTGCQGVPQAPSVFATPASTTYGGPGNLTQQTAKRVARKSRGAAQRLAKALRRCKRIHIGRSRARCEARARRRYRTGKAHGTIYRRASR